MELLDKEGMWSDKVKQTWKGIFFFPLNLQERKKRKKESSYFAVSALVFEAQYFVFVGERVGLVSLDWKRNFGVYRRESQCSVAVFGVESFFFFFFYQGQKSWGWGTIAMDKNGHCFSFVFFFFDSGVKRLIIINKINFVLG